MKTTQAEISTLAINLTVEDCAKDQKGKIFQKENASRDPSAIDSDSLSVRSLSRGSNIRAVKPPEIMAKGLFHRKISPLETLAIYFSDALDAALVKQKIPDNRTLDAIGDIEVLVKHFLKKFSKDEV